MKRPLLLIILFLFLTSVFGQGYVKDRINVKFKNPPTEKQITEIEQNLGLEKVSEAKQIQVVVFRVKSGESVTEVISKLKNYSFIDYAEPDYVYNSKDDKVVNTLNSDSQAAKKAKDKAKDKVKPFYRVESVKFIPNEILVKFKDEVRVENVTALAEKLGARVVEEIPVLGIQRCRIAAEGIVDTMLEVFRADPNVLYAEPNYIVHALEIPNDPDFGKLWGLNNEGQTGGTFDADIDAPEAWDKIKGSRDIILSIIDTGIDYNHPDLANNMWVNTGEVPNNGKDDDNNGYVDDYRGWDFANNDNDPIDDNDHGSHCAGTVGATGNNGKGVCGVNWMVRLMPLKFLTSGGSGSTSDAIKAIIYAVDNGAQILSNSWGGGGSSQALLDAIIYANNHGVLFVAAAGNESKDTDVHPNYPSNYDVENVVSVAAIDDRNYLADFSNYGVTTVDLAAPGVEIYSTTAGNKYAYLSGTSMATPHVAGAAALVWAHYLPRSNKDMVKFRLFGGVDYLRNLQDWVLLDGRLNVNNALSENPLIAVILKPADTDDETGPYPVRASVVDDDSLIFVKLFYKVTNGTAAGDTLDMIPDSPYVFTADIPGAIIGSKIEYKIFAQDSLGNLSETRFYTFNIKKGGNGCCGSFAATVETKEPVSGTLATFLLNFLIFFGPPVFFKWKLRRK